MIRRSWRTLLKAAARERDVLAVVRGFLGEWSSQEVAALPAQAWPADITQGADILSHAALLAGLHARFDGSAAGLPGLQELLLFFTHAAVRTAKLSLLAPPIDPPGDCATRNGQRRSNGRRARGATANARSTIRR